VMVLGGFSFGRLDRFFGWVFSFGVMAIGAGADAGAGVAGVVDGVSVLGAVYAVAVVLGVRPGVPWPVVLSWNSSTAGKLWPRLEDWAGLFREKRLLNPFIDDCRLTDGGCRGTLSAV
jgi:hypothetical protein